MIRLKHNRLREQWDVWSVDDDDPSIRMLWFSCRTREKAALLIETMAAALGGEKPRPQRAKILRLVDHERQILAEALLEEGGNRKRAAERLGLKRTTLLGKLKRYNLT